MLVLVGFFLVAGMWVLMGAVIGFLVRVVVGGTSCCVAVLMFVLVGVGVLMLMGVGRLWGALSWAWGCLCSWPCL